jgi:hypothetical protein
MVTHTTSNVEGVSEYGGLCEKRLLAIVMTSLGSGENPHHGQKPLKFTALVAYGKVACDLVIWWIDCP